MDAELVEETYNTAFSSKSLGQFGEPNSKFLIVKFLHQ